MNQNNEHDYCISNPNFLNDQNEDNEITSALQCVKEINVYEVAMRENGTPVIKRTPAFSMKFSRNIFNDVRYDTNNTEVDIICLPAYYAYYIAVLSDVKKALLMAKSQHEYYRSAQRVSIMKNWNDPNIEKPTVAIVDSMIDVKDGNRFLLGIVDDIEAFYEKLNGWTWALRMKHTILTEDSKNKRAEVGLYGNTAVRGIK